MTSFVDNNFIERLLTPEIAVKTRLEIGKADACGFSADLRSSEIKSELFLLSSLYDSIMLAVCFPDIEQHKDDDHFKEYQSVLRLFFDDLQVDARQVTSANRRHQFLVPITKLLSAKSLSLQNSQDDTLVPSSPAFSFLLWAVNSADIYESIEDRMIWIFGAARSGTTWLLHDILGRIPSFSIPTDDTGNRPIDEPNIGQIIGAIDLNPEPLYWMFSGKVVNEASDQHDLNGKKFRVDPAFERIYDRVSGKKESILEEKNVPVVREALRSIVFGTVFNNWGCVGYDRVVLKCPNGIHAADVILNILSRSRVIAIFRDPREIIRSHFGAFSSRVLNESSDQRLRNFSLSYWAHLLLKQFTVLDRALEAVDDSRKLVLKYEELRHGDIDTFRKLFAFVDTRIKDATVASTIAESKFEAMPADEKGRGKPRDIARVDAFRETFFASEIKLMEEILHPFLAKLCYPPFAQAALESTANSDALIEEAARLGEISEAVNIRSISGFFNDGWSGGHLLLKGTALAAITSCKAKIYCPARFYPEKSHYRFSFRVNSNYQNFLVHKEDNFELEMAVHTEPEQPIEIEIVADQHFQPTNFGSSDGRILSFIIALSFEIDKQDEPVAVQQDDAPSRGDQPGWKNRLTSLIRG